MKTNFQKTKSKDQPSLPRSVEEYLRTGVPEGERNQALFAAATKLRDLPMPEEYALYHLEPRALADGLPPDEIRSAIASAYSRPPREPAVSAAPIKGGYSPRPDAGASYRIASSVPSMCPLEDAEPISLPDRIECGFEKLAMAAFEEGEGICIGGTFEDDDGNHKPESGVTLSREKWLEKVNSKRAAGDLGKVLTGKNGIFIRVNPMRVDPKSKNSDSDVSALRHILVEFDLDQSGNRIPKDRQLGAILASNLPVTAVLDSGNKSIHAWVRVDAKNRAEYDIRVQEVYSAFGCGVDLANKNPSRYSRCPDGLRTENGKVERQSLLMLNVGAESWDSWKRQHEKAQAMAAAASPLPPEILAQLAYASQIETDEPKGEIEEVPELLKQFPVVSGSELQANHPNPPEPVIEGLVGRGEKLILGSASKAGKTFCILNLAGAVTVGGDWLGFKCRKGKVLFINFEVSAPRMAERNRHLAAAGVDLSDVEFFNLRGAQLNWQTLLLALRHRARLENYSLIILDPIYKLLDGTDENNNSEVAKMMSEVEQIAVGTGALIAYVHHFSKGNQAGKDAMDAMSGAGVFARDPDAILCCGST